MGIPEELPYISIDEYLVGEEHGEIHHEYIAGAVYAMSGASEAHGLIAGNTFTAIRTHLRGKPCKAFVGDMKVRVQLMGDDIFYYPDIVVTCDPADTQKYYKTAPNLLVEVLSDSTARIDRREKLLTYRELPSVEEIVLIQQNEPRLSIYRRRANWSPQHVEGIDADAALESIDLPLPLALVYEDVTFE